MDARFTGVDPSDLVTRDEVACGERMFSLPIEEFEAVRGDVESGLDNWIGVVTVDPDDRVLLVRNGWSDGWTVPGGGVESDERLADAAVREVREETGVEVELRAPLLVERRAFVHGDGSVAGHFALYGGTAAEPTLGDDLGVAGETIHDARWFTSGRSSNHRDEIAAFRG